MAKPIILCDTVGMTNDRWLECRMHGPKGDIPYTVGGSDVAAILVYHHGRLRWSCGKSKRANKACKKPMPINCRWDIF